jgi:hypothetical protein
MFDGIETVALSENRSDENVMLAGGETCTAVGITRRILTVIGVLRATGF